VYKRQRGLGDVYKRQTFRDGDLELPPSKKIHLLHGDLRETVARARRHCQKALDEDRTLLDRPENASTKIRYQEIVIFADEFLLGGSYDLQVRAYSKSKIVRIAIEIKKK
jgi:hypothetical protein